ncbi:uncharacterized protein LOC124912115 [Impatiens glandulifera]|uniref:uncharacterized protein LOC124912115 n=1 Tax=Impatiens glandulifera TaxID=253017 RepID=UPI001FB0B49D|nr:uncharacterized protein LOC124912115 [Impatiens glandulifera]
MGGVSSLVRRWMDFAGSHINSFSSTAGSPLPPRPVSEAGTSEFGEDKFETGLVIDSLTDWEVDGVDNVAGNGSNSGEMERPSVADVIKKLTTENQMQGSLMSWKNDHDNAAAAAGAGDGSLGRIQIPAANRGKWQSAASLVLPRIRGRQALADLLMRMEKEREKEVNGLLERRAVSKFIHRGRIQAMLRLRYMRRGIEKEGYSDYYHRQQQERQSRSVETALGVVNRKKLLLISGTSSGERIPRPRKPDDDNRRKQTHSDSDSAEQRTDGTELLVTECCNSKEDQRRSLLEEKATTDSEQSKELECSTSSVVVLRERFNAGAAEISCDAVNLKWTRRDVACCSSSSAGSCSNSDLLKEKTEPLPLSLPLTGDENQSTSSNNAENAPSSESPCPTTETTINEHETATQEEEINVQEELTVSNHESSADEIPQQIGFESGENADGDSMSQQQGSWGYDNEDDQYNGGDESDYDQLGDNTDWILEISRPRSDWEDLRQERYQEMLDPFQHKQDIRELLQRGSVSSFLSSGLRQTIDSLMMSRTQTQPNSARERRERSVISLSPQREPLPLDNQQEEQEVGLEMDDVFVEDAVVEQIEEEEEANLIHWQSDEVEWETNNNPPDHNESSPQQESSHFQSSANTIRCSIELDFLNDLKGNIGQLQEEMSELRRYLKLCISMQEKLQHSLKHDIAAAVKHEVTTVMVKAAEKEEPLKGLKGNCCICYEMKVDSLLYRCGHMCTCFNCAHELQRSSGRCPICRSPIIDIVRPFIDS